MEDVLCDPCVPGDENKLDEKAFVEEETKTTDEKSHPTINETKSRARRFKPGTTTMHKIYKYQKSTNLLIPQLPFRKLVHNLAVDILTNDLNLKDKHVNFQISTLDGIQEYIEDYLVKLMTYANANAIHAHRITVQPKDIKLVKFVRGEN